jgi:hypothetical protein
MVRLWVANTDHEWFDFLAAKPGIDEVNGRLEDKIAVVTGASSGLATAKRFVEEGAPVLRDAALPNWRRQSEGGFTSIGPRQSDRGSLRIGAKICVL